MMQFIRVDIANTYLLESFIQRAGASLSTFRYFATRPLSVVKNHACTWVIEENQEVEAYGHLDREGETVWLGIAVTYHSRGRGLGRQMMRRLIDSATTLRIPTVRLSVDNSNIAAIQLYERFDFRLISKDKKSGVYEWRNERDPYK